MAEPRVHVIDHPLVQHKLTLMRNKEASTNSFRRLLNELSMLMAYEVTRDMATQEVEIETPLEKMNARMIDGKKLVLVSILRAGNGILDGMLTVVPGARVGHIGLYRDPKTLEAVEYYFKMPQDMHERDVVVVDPMLATGNSAVAAIERVKALALLQDGNGRIGGVLAQDGDGRPVELRASETVLCAGGSGGLFAITTNPRSSQGDAIAMAYSAGALIADPEFVQFHPTAIDIGRDPAPLATEALRGDGARLIDRTGRAFMGDYHPLGDLAPRDEVARAIHSERQSGRGAFLDCRAAVGAHFPEHFPTVFAACESAGIDPRTMPIPVAPAMHYHMGGVVTDLWARTSLEGLSACGESASTGAHGANRLASNSLLEAVVFAERAARRLKGAVLSEGGEAASAVAPPVLADSSLAELRRRMHAEVGVVREAAGLGATLDWLAAVTARTGPARALVTAQLIAAAALARQESRGGHYRSDYPQVAAPHRTFVRRRTDDRPEIYHAAIADGA